MKLIDKDALMAEINKLKDKAYPNSDWNHGYVASCEKILSFLNALEVKEVEEPVSNDLEEAARKMATRHSHITGDVYYANDAWFFKKGAQWQKENLWKPADGDDLPEINREVIALIQDENDAWITKVVFAHRPPKHWDGKNILTGEVTRYTPKTYDKGEWNIPNVKFWLNLELPKMEDRL